MLGMLNTYETQNTDPQTPELATESLGSPVAHHGPGKIRRATSVLKMTVSAAKGRFVDASYRFAKILPDVCRVRASAQKRL